MTQRINLDHRGSVYWRADRQKFVAEQTVGHDYRGKKKVRTGTGKTAAEAVAALAKQLQEHATGLSPNNRTYPVKDAIDDFLTHGQHDLDDATRDKNKAPVSNPHQPVHRREKTTRPNSQRR